MISVFIYQPRSGDRVFAKHPARDIRVWRWPNGCRHVYGGVHLAWNASISRQWWREDARELASKVIAAYGGIAWDDCGIINLIVPSRHAWAVNNLFEGLKAALNPQGVREERYYDNLAELVEPVSHRNLAALLVAGCGRLDHPRDQARGRFYPVFLPPTPADMYFQQRPTALHWGEPEVEMERLERLTD